jgi:hypothetical protein
VTEDPIVSEIRRARKAVADEHGNDLRRIATAACALLDLDPEYAFEAPCLD